jgi:hypothetical protein
MAARAAGFQSVLYLPPFAVTDRARFFTSWLRRIAPDTHQDQASGDESAGHPGGVAAPEERWCRSASNGFITDAWLPKRRRQSLAGSGCGRCVYCKQVTAARHPIQTKWLKLQSPDPGLPAAVVAHAKQRFTSKGFFSFRMWKHARASLCASALIATTLFVFAFLRS